MSKDRFNAGGADRAKPAPAPDKLLERGITTRAVLDHLEYRPPDPPTLELTPDDPAIRGAAVEKASAELSKRVGVMRARFHLRSVVMREALHTANEFQKDKRFKHRSEKARSDFHEARERSDEDRDR